MPSASTAILELQKTGPFSGNLSSALHLLGSVRPAAVWSKASNAALFTAATLAAVLNITPFKGPLDAGGGLNGIMRWVLSLGLRFRQKILHWQISRRWT